MDHIPTSSKYSQNWGSTYAWKKALYTLDNNVSLRNSLTLKFVNWKNPMIYVFAALIIIRGQTPVPNMCLFIPTMVFVPMMLTSDDLILEHQHTKVGGEFAAFWQGLIYYYIFAAAGCFHSREKLSSHSPGGLWRLLNSTFIETPFHSSSTPWSMEEKKKNVTATTLPLWSKTLLWAYPKSPSFIFFHSMSIFFLNDVRLQSSWSSPSFWNATDQLC